MFNKTAEPSRQPAPRAGSGSTFSILGADTEITGDISATADLHIDGRVNGDIACASLVQGESSEIAGAVRARTARLAGRLKGSVVASELVILKTAWIEGDVTYDSLTIEQGARVDGRFAPRIEAGTEETGESHLTLASVNPAS